MQNSTLLGILTIVILMISACANNTKKKLLKDFEFEQDFEANKNQFSQDTLALNGHSTEGDELIVFKSNKRTYKVYDVWFYNEMSKRNATYFVNKSNNIKLVKQTTYIYDKPIYLEGATAKKMVQYFTYNKGDFKYFSNIKLEITDEELKSKKRKELEQLFKTILQNIKVEDSKKK